MATLADASAGTTRLQLRRDVSNLIGDFKLATATASGATTTFTDAARLPGPVNAWASREAYVTSGTAGNLLQTRYVLSSTIGGLLTFSLALPFATAIGDEIELRNTRNQGWGVDDIHNAINTALSDANNGFWSIGRDVLSGAFSARAPLMTIPNDYSHVYDVEYQDGSGYWHEVPNVQEDDEPGWRVVQGQRSLQLQGYWATYADALNVRISGYKRFAPLALDTDTTGVNAEWLRYQTAAYLMMQGRERMGDGSRGQMYMTFQSRADRLRDLVTGPPDSRAVAVL